MRTLSSAFLLFAGLGAAVAEQPKAVVKNPVVEASNAFACDLFKKLDESQRGKNLFFSPYSISSALAMTLEGARGDTALEMGKALRLPQELLRKNSEPGGSPWMTGPYNLGFGDFERQISRNADPAKTNEIRAKLAELRKALAEANLALVKMQKEGKFGELNAKSQHAQKLAQSINLLAKDVDQYELKVANALFGEKTYPFKKDYVDAVEKYFGSGHVRAADFRDNYAAERLAINRWIEQQTNDRIKDLIPELPPNVARLVKLVLVNAIYFKGEWSIPFEERSTLNEDFFRADGGKSVVKMMHGYNGEARYAAFNGDGSIFNTPLAIPFGAEGKTEKYPGKDGFHIAEMPVKGGRLSMVVLAPLKADGLGAVEAKLTGAELSNWLAKLQRRTVQIALPRFKMETDYDLIPALKGLGMNQAFDERIADFSAMTTSTNPDDRLSIGKVLHKAFVEVNEKGAEAAAATAVMMMVPFSAVPAAAPFVPEFRADRPFLFVIRDVETGMILFLGRMTNPG